MTTPRLLPFLAWWPRVDRATLRADTMAGLTGAIIVLPQCVAFATLAGLPVEYGLYCAMLPAAVAALFGSSWHLVSGPTNAISIVLFASLAPLAEPGSAAYVQLALTVTLLVGALQLAMGLARLGVVVNFISHTVVVGFMAGAAVLILDAQLQSFFGVDIERGASFLQTWQQFFARIDTIEPWVTVVATASLAAGVATRRWLPRYPYMIVAMAAGSLAALVIEHAVDGDTGIRTVGVLAAGWPPLSWPDLSIAAIRDTALIALAITILGLTEAVSIARAIAVRSGQRIDGTQEFIGQGLSNLVAAFASGYASSGSFNRSGANFEAGAKTPLAAVLSAAFLLILVVFVGPLAAYLPIPALAAVLFMVAWGLVDLGQVRTILRASRQESAVLVVTFAAAVLVNLEIAILAGVLLSLLLYLSRTAYPAMHAMVPDPSDPNRRFTRRPVAPPCPQLAVLRLDGSIFYGAVDHVRDELRRRTAPPSTQRHVLLLGGGINFVDIAGAEMLAAEAARLRAEGGGLHFARLKAPARVLLDRSGTMASIGAGAFHSGKAAALSAIYPRLDSSVCRACTARIFTECRERLPDGSPRATEPAPSPPRRAP